MAKAGIHPDYHSITIVMTDGTKYETRSCWGKEGDVLTLDVDPNTHPAWTGGTGNMRKTGRVERFGERFGATSFASTKASADVGKKKKKTA